jgi:hypothetical protein
MGSAAGVWCLRRLRSWVDLDVLESVQYGSGLGRGVAAGWHSQVASSAWWWGSMLSVTMICVSTNASCNASADRR